MQTAVATRIPSRADRVVLFLNIEALSKSLAMDTDAPTTTPVEAIAATDAPVVFRGKKRKFFRQRPAEEATTTEAAEPEDKTERENPTSNEAPNGDEEGLSVAEIIRQRNARKHRLKGVGFGADDASATAANADDELSLMIREEEQKAIDLSNGGVNRRFTAQTGVSSELVNKHIIRNSQAKVNCYARSWQQHFASPII